MKDLFRTIMSNNMVFPIAVLISLLILLTKFQLSGIVLSDSFHYGEYFATLTTLIHGDFYPFSIHGSLDYIPGFFAIKLFGENNYFFHTWIFYRVLHALSVIIFIYIIYLFTKTNNKSAFLLIGVAIVAPSIVGARDLFLLISIYLFFLIQRENNYNLRLLYELVFGFTVFFSLFWAFDRGIATVVSFGLASIIYSYRHRVYILSLVVFFLTLLLMHYLLPELFSLISYYENIKLLIDTSYQWSYGFKLFPILLTLYIVIYVLLSLWLYIQSILTSKNPRSHIENSLLFILLSLILLKMAINRADLFHIQMAIWVPILSLSYLYYKGIDLKINIYLKYLLNIFLFISLLCAALGIRIHHPSFIVFGLIAIGILFINYSKIRVFIKSKLLPFTYIIMIMLALMFITINKNKYTWVMNTDSLQDNSNSVTNGIRWVSQELIDKKVDCIFDLSNSGVINGLTKLPSCTKFSYIIYADYRHEQLIIESLKNSFPPAIVYSSTHRSFNMDGRSMHERFPKLNEFILSKYPYEKCEYEYCIRYLDIINAH